MAQDSQGIWAGLRDRWVFATQNDEQRFQTRLYSDRRLYNQILSYPSNYIQNRLLRPDIKPKGLFDQAAAFTFVDKWLFGSMGGMVARSMTSGYDKHQHYQRARHAAAGLTGMAMAAEAVEGGSSHLSDEIAAGQHSILNTLFEKSAESGHVLEQFISGKLTITPGNLEKLNTTFEALAALSEQRAELLDAYGALAQKPDGKPASYIREAVSKPQLETLRDAEIYLGFVAALLADSAVPFSSEIYIPQEEVFLTPEQNTALSEAITARLEELGYVVNEAESPAFRPDPDQPEGMLLKQAGEGYAPLSSEDVLAFAREMHGELQQLMGQDIPRLLDFADARFEDIGNTLANSKAAKAAVMATPEITVGALAAQSITPVAERAFRRNGSLLRDGARVAQAAGHFMTRPHIDTEVSKLWGRSISNQIMAFPVNIFDEVLRNFFRTSKEGKPRAGFDVMLDRIRGEKDSEMGSLFDAEAFRNNLKSRGFRFFSQSLIASVGVVYSQQSTRVGAMLASDAAQKSDPLIAAAIQRGQHFVPEFAARVQQVKGQHPSLQALLEHPDYKGRITPMLSGETPPDAEGFRLLSRFFHDMSRVSVSMAEEVLSPFQTGKGKQALQSMDEVAARLFDKPITTVPDAMMALAFAQSFMQLSKEHIEMIEYVDPDKLMLKPDALKEMGYFMQDEAKRLGLRLKSGKDGAQLVDKQGNPASAEAIVALGQGAIGKLNSLVNVHMLIGAARGDMRDAVVERMENRLFDGVHFATQAEQPTPAATNAPPVEPWAAKVHRPVKSAFTNIRERWKHPEVQHERQKLFDRLQGERLTSTVSTLIQKSLQHQNSVFDRGNLIYTAWTYAAYPTLYGKGIVDVREVWDEMLSRKRSILNDAEQASAIAAAAIMAAGQAEPDLSRRLGEFMTSNLLVEGMEQDFHHQDIARIAAKPRSERSAQDDAVMEAYFARSGEQMLTFTGNMLSGLSGQGGKESFREVITRVCDAPVNTLGDAVAGLSFLSSAIAQDATALEKQTYTDPKDILLQKKALKALGGFMSDQAHAAGFAVNGEALPGAVDTPPMLDSLPKGCLLEQDGKGGYRAASEESVIRFANVALAKFRDIREQHPETARAFDHLLQGDKQQRAVLAAKQTAAMQLQ